MPVTRQFRAPAEDRGLLADPPLDAIGDQVDINARLLSASPVRVAGVPLAELRRSAVAEVIAAARLYLSEAGEPTPSGHSPLLVAGHQPDLFHPGVWAKNFALNGLAARLGRTPLNLVVDNDTMKGFDVRWPSIAANPRDVHQIAVPFDRADGDIPYEERRPHDPAAIATLVERCRPLWANWGYTPLLPEYWSKVREHLDGGQTFGEAFVRGRRYFERRWGAINLELPVSRLASGSAFATFCSSLLSEMPRFAAAYNGAIRAYRRRNRLRSRHHPAPELAVSDGWWEAPLWVWRADAPRRAKLFVRRGEGCIDLRMDGRTLACLPAQPDALSAGWQKLTADGWKLRPRALTLTLFARLCLADGFLHGIGGGKYDEVTDDIIRAFFQTEPPGYAVVSATLRLPLKRFPATTVSVHAAERRVRDLEWNPQQSPETVRKLPELVAAKDRLVRMPPQGKARREWFQSLHLLTREMRPAVEGTLATERTRLQITRDELAANDILGRRDYAWPLFPEELLRSYFARFR